MDYQGIIVSFPAGAKNSSPLYSIKTSSVAHPDYLMGAGGSYSGENTVGLSS